MAKGNTNKGRNAAKSAKKDEFYTQLSDIENELCRYDKKLFEGKVVYCNCDDPYESNFFKYFVLYFRSLGLKKLICTCYDGSPIAGTQLDLPFGDTKSIPKRVAHKIVITDVQEFYRDGKGFKLDDIKGALLNGTEKAQLEQLKGNGDFQSPECIELLKEADIVVTNPPFSCFHKYFEQLFEYNKKFLIVGNQESITYKEVFPRIKANKVWLGFGFKGGAAHFVSHYKDVATAGDHKEGMIRVSGVVWFTNLEHKKRLLPLELCKSYHKTPEKYPHYENYDAIEVKPSKHIPYDYDGVMGVPITFLNVYNPSQFEIIGATESEGKGFSAGLWHRDSKVAKAVVNGEHKYKRLFIRRK